MKKKIKREEKKKTGSRRNTREREKQESRTEWDNNRKY